MDAGGTGISTASAPLLKSGHRDAMLAQTAAVPNGIATIVKCPLTTSLKTEVTKAHQAGEPLAVSSHRTPSANTHPRAGWLAGMPALSQSHDHLLPRRASIHQSHRSRPGSSGADGSAMMEVAERDGGQRTGFRLPTAADVAARRAEKRGSDLFAEQQVQRRRPNDTNAAGESVDDEDADAQPIRRGGARRTASSRVLHDDDAPGQGGDEPENGEGVASG